MANEEVKRDFSFSNLHSSFILSIALLFGVSSAWAATESNWIETSVGGSENSPFEIWNTVNWDNGVGSGCHLNFTVSGKTYIQSAKADSIAADFRVNSGDFVFIGPLKFLCYKNNKAQASVSVLKKGMWTITNYNMFIGYAKGSTVAFTNETGNVVIKKDNNTKSDILYIAGGEDTTVEVVNKSGSWSVGQTAFIGSGKNSTARFYNRGGSLTAAGYGVCLGENTGGTTGLAYLEISGGAVTNIAKNLSIGDGNSDGTAEVRVNGGEYCAKSGSVVVGNRGRGTLTIDSGRVIASDSGIVFCNLSQCVEGRNCFLNLNGGTLETKKVTYGGGSAAATFTFNGGTLKALAAGTLIEKKNKLTVTVDDGGGTIDNGGYDITVAADVRGTGGLNFAGGGTTTLSGAVNYSGGTIIEAGTVVVVPDVATRSALGVITVTGLGYSACEVVRLSGEGTFSADHLPMNTETVMFAVSSDGKSILAANVKVGSFWIGGSGDLGVASNWSDGKVPMGNSATISWTSPITLTNSGTFAPSSITFGAGSASVTIDGDDIIGIVAITNLSSASHTINAKVNFFDKILVVQGAMSWEQKSNSSIRFAGGVTGTTFAEGTARYLDGLFTLTTGKDWVANTQGNNNRWGLPEGSSLTLPSAVDTSELALGDSSTSGGAFTSGVVRTSTRLLCWNHGEYVVTNEFTATFLENASLYSGIGNISNCKYKFEKMKLEGAYDQPFKFGNSRNASNTSTLHFYIGSGGLCFENGASRKLRYEAGGAQNNATFRIDPWHGDYTINTKSALNPIDFTVSAKTYFGTTDENGIACTVTDKGVISSFGDTAQIHIDGNGTFVVNAVCTATCPVMVEGTATLKYASSDATFGSGTVTFDYGTTFAFVNIANDLSGMPAIALSSNGEGKSTIQIDGTRLKSNTNLELISTGAPEGCADRVTVIGNALGNRKYTLTEDSGKLYINVLPSGLRVIVK